MINFVVVLFLFCIICFCFYPFLEWPFLFKVQKYLFFLNDVALFLEKRLFLHILM